ncbi:hypothetical protein ACFPRL_15765 [Pseudoclavibacter helvolus]
MPLRNSRYSGSERPACRMNHTGSVSGRSPRAARMSGASAVRPEESGCESLSGRGAGAVSVTGPFSHQARARPPVQTSGDDPTPRRDATALREGVALKRMPGELLQ